MKAPKLKKLILSLTLAIAAGVFLSTGIVYTETPAPEPMQWATPPYTPTRVEVEKIPPIPDPMEWEVEPRMIIHERFSDGRIDCTITMTAVRATAAGGGEVEYYFECLQGMPPGYDIRGWRTAREASVRLPGLIYGGYTFHVKARDALFKNETAFSDPPLAPVIEEP